MAAKFDDFEYELTRGDDEEFPFTVTLQGVTQDLSAWTEFWLTAKTLLSQADEEAAFQLTLTGGGIVLTDAAAGQGKAVLSADDYAEDFPYKRTALLVDLQGLDASGKRHTLCSGRLIVYPDATRS